MEPNQIVVINGLHEVRAAVQQYLADNVGYRAEDRDLVWSWRYLVAKLALLTGQKMSFGDLEGRVSIAQSETSSELIKFLTPGLIAKKICTPVPGEFLAHPPPPVPVEPEAPVYSETSSDV